MAHKLAGAPRQTALRALHGWTEVDGRDAICKTYHFADFNQAFGFMTRIAMLAEKRGRHPEWYNAYDRVEIFLSTPELDGVTEDDVDFARAIDAFAPEHDRS